jgi:hypothetical protein
VRTREERDEEAGAEGGERREERLGRGEYFDGEEVNGGRKRTRVI